MPDVDFAGLIKHLRSNITLADALPDEAACRSLLAAHRFHLRFLCQRCGNTDGRVSNAGWRCRVCGLRIGLTAQTPLHGTHLPIRIWLAALWWLTCTPTGIAARRFHRVYGLGSVGSAWRLLHRVRRIVHLDSDPSVLRLDHTTRAAVQVLGRRRPDHAATVGISASASELSVVVTEVYDDAITSLGGEHEPRTGRLLLESFRTWIAGTFHGVSRNYLHLYALEFFARLQRPLSISG